MSPLGPITATKRSQAQAHHAMQVCLCCQQYQILVQVFSSTPENIQVVRPVCGPAGLGGLQLLEAYGVRAY